MVSLISPIKQFYFCNSVKSCSTESQKKTNETDILTLIPNACHK